MDPLGQLAQARDKSVVADAQQRAGLVLVDGHGLDHDETGSSFGVRGVAVDDVLVDLTVLAAEVRHHGRDHDAVRNHHSIDVQRFKQFHFEGSRKWVAVTSVRRRRSGCFAR